MKGSIDKTEIVKLKKLAILRATVALRNSEEESSAVDIWRKLDSDLKHGIQDCTVRKFCKELWNDDGLLEYAGPSPWGRAMFQVNDDAKKELKFWAEFFEVEVARERQASSLLLRPGQLPTTVQLIALKELSDTALSPSELEQRLSSQFENTIGIHGSPLSKKVNTGKTTPGTDSDLVLSVDSVSIVARSRRNIDVVVFWI